MNPKTFVRNRILRTLGTVGWEGISLYVFASALTGSPVCVYGSHGAAKTMTFRLLAEKCFGLPYVLYDASKSNWVDIVGYPNLDKFKEGKVEFVETEMSIWNKKILILDEAARAREDIQNGYLEVLRSSTLQGVDTGIRWKFLASNTLDYPGTRPLDAAFASRIGYYCAVPEFLNMDVEDQGYILQMQENSDGRGLREWDKNMAPPEDNIPDMSLEFSSLMTEAAAKMEEVKTAYGEMFAEYVRKFAALMEVRTKVKGSDVIRMDGRTCGTLLNNMYACVALESLEYEVAGEEFTEDTLRECVAGVVSHSFPWVLTGQKVNPQAVSEALDQVAYILKTRDLVAFTLATEKNPVKKIMLSLEMEDLEPVAIYDAVEELLENPDSMECIMFCALMGEESRAHLFEKLNANSELKDRIYDRLFDISMRGLEFDGAYKLQTEQVKILYEEYGMEIIKDGDLDLVKDMHLRFALLYLANTLGGNALEEGQDIVQFRSELKRALEFIKEVDATVNHNYKETREALLAFRETVGV